MVCYCLHIYDVIPLSAHKIGLFSPREARDGYECSISGHYHVRKLGNGVKAFFELSLTPHISRRKLYVVNGPVDGSTNSVYDS